MRERWGESIFRQMAISEDLFAPVHDDDMASHDLIASKMRNKYYFNNLEPLNV